MGDRDKEVSSTSYEDTRSLVKQIEVFTKRLNSIGETVGTLGLSIAIFTAMHIFFVISFTTTRYIDSNFVVQMSGALTGVIVFVVVFWEHRKRSGESLYEVLTDEIHRLTARGEPQSVYNTVVDAHLRLSELRLTARHALRDFSRMSELPLIPGKFGAGIYVLINIAITLVLVFMKVRFYEG